MSERQTFFEAIRNEPDDDMLRLVYADWLEEQGDPRGEFIRVQVRLAQLPFEHWEVPQLVRQQETLLALNGDTWREELPRVPGLRPPQ